ncbi:hypothetical protein CANINC_004180 [Pichia inconspicua]|uniref:Centrosomin N-terminal motif 1 domain-containing protein n=1 Tax=Pichia inconspicua TaxID=52247 RepID=A0A4V4NF89_9ASCO|nr:hypothetical protein CANINC_004180 [[Candida] inconspicua]
MPFTPNKKLSSPEFTPIGSKSTNLEPTNSISNISPLRFQRNREYKANNNHHYPLHRRKQRDDIDLIQSSSVASSVWDDDMLHDEKDVPTGKFSRLFGNNTNARDETGSTTKYGVLNTEINDDGNMIKEQGELVKKLQSENTNLRIEVLTLRRHMTGIPSDSMDLIEQNVLLNQELMKLKELVGERPDNTEELYEVHRDLSSMNEKYTQVLQEKDKLLRESFEKDSDLEKLRGQCAKYESEVFELKMELDELKQKQSSQHDERNEEEIGILEDEKLQLQRELEQLSKDYDDLEKENEQLKENVNSLQTQLDDIERDVDGDEVEELRHNVEELRKEKERQAKEHDSELRSKYLQYREKIDDMTQQLQEATRSLEDNDKELFEKEKDIEVLRKEVKQLSSDLDTMEMKNKLLEKQMKQAGSESEATRLLSEEVEKLYRKIESYEKQIHELTDELNKAEDELEYAKNVERENHDLEETVARLKAEVKRKDDELKNFEEKVEENDDESESESSYVDGILQLKDKFEEERAMHSEEVEKILKESEQVQNNLLAQIDELETSKEQLISDYDSLKYEYDLLLAKTNDVDVEELGRDLAKISLEYKRTLDERYNLAEMYEKEVSFLKKELKRVEESKTKENGINVESLYQKLDTLEKTVKELRDKKSELEKEVRELGDDKVKLVSENKELKKYVKRWEEVRTTLEVVEKERDKLRREIENLRSGEAEVLMKSNEVRNKVQLKEVSKQALIREYELKLAAKDEQYNAVVKEFNFMKDDLISRLKQMKSMIDEKNSAKIGVQLEWKNKYEEILRKLKLVEKEAEELRRELRNNEATTWYPPTPESPSRTRNVIPIGKYELLRVQKELLMLKYAEKSEKLSDLKFLVKYYTLENEYYSSIIESNRRILEDD